MRLEGRTHFDQFEGPLMVDSDFSAKSTVLIMGQCQSGKTSFIRFLLQRDFPGSQSEDKFVALTHSSNDVQLVSGKEAVSATDSPFKALASFGSGLLDRFQVSELESPLLEHLTLIDSPGSWMLNELDSAASYYRFWAGKADAIMLVFDAERSDISEHFAKLIVALKGNLQKVRVVLNKADGVGHQQLMRNYGAFVWSLGKIVQNEQEVDALRVYVSSFWDKPYRRTECTTLFDAEKEELLSDLKKLPRSSTVHKVDEFVKRTRRVKVHALICEAVKNQIGIFGKEKQQKELLRDLEAMAAVFKMVSQRHDIPQSALPNPYRFANAMKQTEIWKIPQLKAVEMNVIDEVLNKGVPRLLEQVGVKGYDVQSVGVSDGIQITSNIAIEEHQFIVEVVQSLRELDADAMNKKLLKLISKFQDDKRWKKLFEIIHDENNAFRFKCVYYNDNPSAFNTVFSHLLIEAFVHLLKRELYLHKDGDKERAVFVRKMLIRFIKQQFNASILNKEEIKKTLFLMKKGDVTTNWPYTKQCQASLESASKFYENQRDKFAVKMCADSKTLLLFQKEFDHKMAICGHSARTLGLSAMDTVREMLKMGDIEMAERVKRDLLISEKRWWFLRMKMYGEEGEYEKLSAFIDDNSSKKKPPPIGYMAIIEVFLEMEQMDLVKKYAALIGEIEERLEVLCRLKLWKEAVTVAVEQRDFDALRMIQEQCTEREIVQRIEKVLRQHSTNSEPPKIMNLRSL